MNVRERHETQCHVESGVFIVPLIVMVIYIYIYIYIYVSIKYIKITAFQTSPVEKERNKRLNFIF